MSDGRWSVFAPGVVGGAYVRSRRWIARQLWAVASMILTQVHLRKPCYDFYFLEVIKFVSLSAPDATPEGDECRAQSAGLTKPLNR